MLGKKIAWVWGPQHDKEWEDIKNILSSSPVLAYYDSRKPTKVSTDASRDGLGAVLLQQHDGEWNPVAYGARSLTSAETRYAQIEKECLGLAYGCEKFHHYIYGLDEVQLETDHKPLVPLSKKDLNDMTPRIQRLMLKLQRHNYNLSWTPGKNLYLADTLSRADLGKDGETPSEMSEPDVQVHMVMQTLSMASDQMERIAAEKTAHV